VKHSETLMETSPYFSALVGLAGVAVGGMTSFATTWLTQITIMREKRLLVEAAKREKLFNEFVAEASRLYGDALSHGKDEIVELVKLYSLIGRMRLICSDRVIEAAQRTLDSIIDTYLAPNRNLRELHELARTGRLNPLIDFDLAGREELQRFGSGGRRCG
jgi:hypothetical protein